MILYVVVEARLPKKRVLVYAVPLTGTLSDPQDVKLGIGEEETRVVGVFVAPEPPETVDDAP